jgi:DUF971 family protein
MTRPVALSRHDGGRTLAIDWGAAGTSRLPAERLRGACRCADCTRARADGRAATSDPATTVVAIEPVGGYGVNLQFSDGHARGIFPWAYLRELAAPALGGDAITCSTAADGAGSVPPDPARKDAP